MNTKQARAHFDDAIAQQSDPDKRAKLELAREYFCNPEFRAALSDYVWAINNGDAA